MNKRDLVARKSTSSLLREAYRQLYRVLQAEIAFSGISASQWSFLRALWEQDGLTQTEITERVSIEKAAAAEMIDTLEGAGLVRRVRNTADRRRINIHLTAKGKRVVQEILPHLHVVLDKALRGISKEALAQAETTIETIISNLKDG
jgi:MarR family transcriptional regulator, organic hydroperoxide resistance regulator